MNNLEKSIIKQECDIHKNEVQNIGLESPSNFQVKENKILFKSVHKQEIGHLWSRESIEGKYNPHQISKSKKKNLLKSVQKNKIMLELKMPKSSC